MSVQFGRWNFDGELLAEDYVHELGKVLSRYGPDGGNCYFKDGVSILYHAFHTTKESRQEAQPHVLISRAVLTWDGRLDNRSDLVRQIKGDVSIQSTDLLIVAAAYEQWGTDCFPKLIGDWALSVWDPQQQFLILARDPIGGRHLYYWYDSTKIIWSTVLDPFLLSGQSFTLDKEYVAGWLSSSPAPHLTPYVGVHAVPPSCFVRLDRKKRYTKQYWDFDSDRKVRYRTDAEYEEHFRIAFATSVRRRIRSDSAVIAELSGGIDSSSIVCVADTILRTSEAGTPTLDTVSYYDDSEPNWNERPYFGKVEQRRGCVGLHIDICSGEFTPLEFAVDAFAPTPPLGIRPQTAVKQFAEYVASQGYRVLLSGIGGDEVTGGIPTPIPGLGDLLARARLRSLASELKLWALKKKKPWFHLLLEAVRQFMPPVLADLAEHRYIPVWLHHRFVKEQWNALRGYQRRIEILGPLPSFQDNISTLNSLRGQVGCWAPSSEPPLERRYPFLDRDLLEFLFAVPRDQLVRPGQRRSLIRRALTGIVPNEVLNRKRKAFVARSLLLNISFHWNRLQESNHPLMASCCEIIDRSRFEEGVARSRRGLENQAGEMIRAVILEYWLRSLADRELLFSTSRPGMGVDATKMRNDLLSWKNPYRKEVKFDEIRETGNS